MSTQETATVTMTIDAPPETVSADLADPSAHLEWATEFFSGTAQDQGDGTWQMNVPRMGANMTPGLLRVYQVGAAPLADDDIGVVIASLDLGQDFQGRGAELNYLCPGLGFG